VGQIDYRLSLFYWKRYSLIPWIRPIEEGFDVTVRVAKLQESASLIVHPLVSVQQLLCAAPSYLATHGIPVHLDELRSHSCLHYGQLAVEGQWTLMGVEGEQKVLVSGVLCSNNGEVLRDAAVRGLGIISLPMFIIAQELQQGTLRRVLPDYEPPALSIAVIYPINRHLSTKVRLLTDFLRDRNRTLGRAFFPGYRSKRVVIQLVQWITAPVPA
jgi:DNA-binding transcriptional LysR family regulator